MSSELQAEVNFVIDTMASATGRSPQFCREVIAGRAGVAPTDPECLFLVSSRVWGFALKSGALCTCPACCAEEE